MDHLHHAEDVLGPGGLFASALPGYESRPAQLKLTALVEDAFAQRSPVGVAAEAGTGTGKSLAYLVPAVLSGRKTLVTTTNKVLQGQIVGKDLPEVQAILGPAGVHFTYVVAKGRGNYACKERVGKLEAAERIGALDLGAKSPEQVAALAEEWEGFKAWHAATVEGDVEEINPLLSPALREQVTITSEDCLGKTCPLFDACWVTRKKQQAETAQIIVANYHVVLLDAVLRDQTDDQAAVLPDGITALVLDEAHGSEDVATSVLGEEVSLSAWWQIQRRLKNATEGAINRADRAARRAEEDLPRDANEWPQIATSWQMKAGAVAAPLLEWIDVLKERLAKAPAGARQVLLGDERSHTARLLERALAFSDEMAQGTPPWAIEGSDRQAWQKLATAVARFAKAVYRVSNPEDLSVARYAEESGSATNGTTRIAVYAKPIDVAPEMKRLLWDRYPTLVATSATLATGGANDPSAFDYWMERVGFPRGERPVATLVVGSPFDYANHALLYVPQVPAATVGRTAEAAEATTAFVAHQMRALVEASNGGAFLLFTSYRQMAAVARRVIPTLPRHYRVFVQGEQPRDVVIREFRDAAMTVTQPAVLFATRSYFEGVDVRGEGLRLVVLDKLPFTNISDPVFQARCRVIDRVSDGTYATGSFARLALPIMTTVLKQGTGRLIRSQTDRGVVAILDDRLATKGYGKKVLGALPPMARTRTLGDVQAFYERGRTA